jgi:hypothetical protein
VRILAGLILYTPAKYSPRREQYPCEGFHQLTSFKRGRSIHVMSVPLTLVHCLLHSISPFC